MSHHKPAEGSATTDYGFIVGDSVNHVGDNEMEGIVTELDTDYDLGGVTTCRVAWGAKTVEAALASPREDQDIQWTNKLTRAH
jgi:hypothetical protein